MAIDMYDEALYKKIQSWVKDPKMRILKPDETTRLFQQIAKQSLHEDIKLPIIAISRDSQLHLNYTNKKALSFDGKKIGTNEKTNQVIQLNAIPVSLSYQIDIYTRRYEEGDEYVRNFAFNLINYPSLNVIIPYNGINIEHIAHVSLQSDITDNSDIKEKLFPDQFTRWTMRLDMKDAYLFSVPVKDACSIEDAGLKIDTVNAEGEVIDEEKENI